MTGEPRRATSRPIARTTRLAIMLHTKQRGRPHGCRSDLGRFELVRGFSKRRLSWGVSFLTAISWLIYGKRNDRPATVCSILAQCGRQVNDILADDDRQRLKIFICRLAGSKDCEAKKRRTRIFVDVVMRGLLEMDGLSPKRAAVNSARPGIGKVLDLAWSISATCGARERNLREALHESPRPPRGRGLRRPHLQGLSMRR